jgi:hypothetical protein
MMRENGIFLILVLLDSRLRGNDLIDIHRGFGHVCRRLLTPEFYDEPSLVPSFQFPIQPIQKRAGELIYEGPATTYSDPVDSSASNRVVGVFPD